MPYLYIANATYQEQEFIFRRLKNKQPITQQIPMGMIVRLPFDMDQEEIRHIVEQHERYGMINVADIDRALKKVPLIWSLREITEGQVMKALEHNRGALNTEGAMLRKQAAVGIDSYIKDQYSQTADPNEIRRNYNETQVEIREMKSDVTRRGPDDHLKGEGINELMRVRENGHEPPPAPRAARRRRAA